ncbi:MAG: 16S rRNA (guanine(966)-N(2))-methyltransferase RsmD [Gammaproteobacteria bacterium RIFCSPHIGHO2_12_FULL_37_14]|nr:MAG: 16S rRNA (guanine(966)-N(2))-methyltransferase RsmD [Gammaproteobacteria bacterium RIFCSPHIGHO2_12_FULL_37_14]
MMKPGFVRIIGGKWRRRRLQVPLIAGLRPTPDRVRETVFNWLTPTIGGAYCLDLFAGSGALGIEALSRGAAFVVFVDRSPQVVTLLKEELIALEAPNADVYQANIPLNLRKTDRPFDIVFLDPPYADNLLLPSCFYLEEHGFLAPSAQIYLEAECAIKDNELPNHWRIVKCQKAGQVIYHLVNRE